MISDFCKLFISSQDKNLISLAIENFFKSPLINGKYIETEMLDIYFFNNDEFDEKRNFDFKDNFLYFPFIIEIIMLNQYDIDECINKINNFLEYLNHANIITIISCDFEEMVPALNRYKP